MILLRHELPDATFHYDWLLDDPACERLRTFRATTRIDLLEPAARAMLDVLEPHRRVYLTYEGPLAEAPDSPLPGIDRGSVTAVARGRYEQGPTPGELGLHWRGGEIHRIRLVVTTEQAFIERTG